MDVLNFPLLFSNCARSQLHHLPHSRRHFWERLPVRSDKLEAQDAHPGPTERGGNQSRMSTRIISLLGFPPLLQGVRTDVTEIAISLFSKHG